VRMLVLLASALAMASLHAQSPDTFGVISIKPNRTGAAASETDTTPGRISLINVTPQSLIRRAFGVQDWQIEGGPDWLLTERYDVIATVGEGRVLNDRDRQPFFERLLAERWHFRFHRETRERGVYSLRVSNPSRLVPHRGPGEYAMRVEPAGGRVVIRSTRGNIPRLVEILNRFSDRLIVDETGLGGEYGFTLDWVQDPALDAAGATLFTALREQLGLELEPVRRPMPVIVIDWIERPSPN